MIKGVVMGEVWATRKHPRLEGRKLLLVAQLEADDHGNDKPTGRIVVATDLLDARIGDKVVVSFGSGARNAVKPGSRDVLVDAAIVQIVEGDSEQNPT